MPENGDLGVFIMERVKIFPLILICLSIGAGIFYYIDGDWRRGTYWFAAATLNFVVTF